MNELSSSSRHSMSTRIITAIVIALVGFPSTIFGTWYFFAVIMFLAIVGIHEFVKAPNKNRYNIFIYIVAYSFVLSFILWQFIKPYLLAIQVGEHSFFLNMETVNFSTVGIITYFLFLFIVCLFTEKFTVQDASYLFTIGIYFAIAISALLFLRYYPCQDKFYGWDNPQSSLLFFYVLTGTYMTDIGAYFVGVFFGKHKMAPRISPHKTWEGFAGGVVFSVIFSFGFAAVCNSLGAPLLKGYLDFEGNNWWWILLLSLIMPLCANFGDLIFSAIKRTYAIKDFGRIFPGHGGVLDRIDSLSFSCACVAVLIIFICHNWNFLA